MTLRSADRIAVRREARLAREAEQKSATRKRVLVVAAVLAEMLLLVWGSYATSQPPAPSPDVWLDVATAAEPLPRSGPATFPVICFLPGGTPILNERSVGYAWGERIDLISVGPRFSDATSILGVRFADRRDDCYYWTDETRVVAGATWRKFARRPDLDR